MKRIMEMLDEAVQMREEYLLGYLITDKGEFLGVMDLNTGEIVKTAPVGWWVWCAIVYEEKLWLGTEAGVQEWKRRVPGRVLDEERIDCLSLTIYKGRLWVLQSDDLGCHVGPVGGELREVVRESGPEHYLHFVDYIITTSEGRAYIQYPEYPPGDKFVIAEFDMDRGVVGEAIYEGKRNRDVMGTKFEVVEGWILTCGAGDRIVACHMKTGEEKEVYRARGYINRFQIKEHYDGFEIIAGDNIEYSEGSLPSGNSSYLGIVRVDENLNVIEKQKVKLDDVSGISPLLSGGYKLLEVLGEENGENSETSG